MKLITGPGGYAVITKGRILPLPVCELTEKDALCTTRRSTPRQSQPA